MNKTATLKPAVRPVRGTRKNMRINQRKLDQVRRILGARTETEAVERAMDEVIFRERAVAGMARLVGRGGFRPLSDDES